MKIKTLSFDNLVLDVVNETADDNSDMHKRLIKGISGQFDSGNLSAIMGMSGSGKTSLINVLSGHIRPTSMTHGCVLFEGMPRSPKRWLSQMAFLEQDDWIVPGQTVWEYIHFQISCRSRHCEGKAVNALVSKIMNDLHISNIRDTKLDSISGGERKRVMIAVELALEPEVLILDEPTTGLDSHLALELVCMVKKYAVEQNKIVVMTVHQPGSAMFEMFDTLLFVHKGVCVYSGPVCDVEEFFNFLGIERTEDLSKPEFLFEIFSENSVFPSYLKYQPVMDQLTRQAMDDSYSRVAHKRLRIGNDHIILLDTRPSNVYLLFKRILVLDWRHRKLQKIVGIEFLYLIFFCLGRFYTELSAAFTEIGVDARLSPGGLLSLCHRLFGSHRFPGICEALCHSLYLFPLLLTLVSPRSAISRKDYLSRESEKGVYTAMTLYLALVLSDSLYGAIRSLLFIALLIAFGLGPGLTPSLVYFIFTGIFLSTVFMLLFKCLTPSRILHTTLISAFKVGLVFFGRPHAIRLAVKAMGNTPLAPLKHLFSFWCHLPHETYSRSGLIRRMLAGKCSEEYERFIKAILNLPEPGSAASITKAEKAHVLDGGYPDYFLLAILSLSAILTATLSILLLTRRFSPKLRLLLSK
jgi:ATP-binding cassette, subfamily G (WHITE), member 1